MRQITKDSVNAFYNGDSFKRDNTVVAVWGNVIQLELHRHNIATYYKLENKLMISSCGWLTNTTKERLNGVLDKIGVKIYQKKGVWYVWNMGNDESIEFVDGMEFRV